MKPLTNESLLSDLEARLGVERDDAVLIARAVTLALADVLSPPASHHVAAVLPAPFASLMSRGKPHIGKRRVFLERVSGIAHTRASSAWEDTIVMCDLVRDALGEELAVVRASLPRDLKTLFDDRPPAEALPRVSPPPQASEAVPAGQTLSRGRPGSTNPIASSPGDVRGPAQHGSVADHNPHADRKISSAHAGSNETLSSGRPR